jgi:hypothetical protein
MDIHARKIAFIREFLNLQSEETISQLESLLKKEKIKEREGHFKPMSVKELNDRIDKSEEDFRNNRYKSSSDLLAKF